jgi:hypothetical protein
MAEPEDAAPAATTPSNNPLAQERPHHLPLSNVRNCPSENSHPSRLHSTSKIVLVESPGALSPTNPLPPATPPQKDLAASGIHEPPVHARRHRGTDRQRQQHREYDAADVDQFSAWRPRRWSRRSSFHDRFHTSASEMIRGIHRAFLVLGGLTVLSAVVFRELKSHDGDNVSLHEVPQHVA